MPLEPKEMKQITDAFRYEFKTFKEDKMEPLVKTVNDIGAEVVEQGKERAADKAKLDTVEAQSNDNKRNIFKIALTVIGGLITLCVALLVYMWT